MTIRDTIRGSALGIGIRRSTTASQTEKEYERQREYGRKAAVLDEEGDYLPQTKPAPRKPEKASKQPLRAKRRPAEGHEVGLATCIKLKKPVRLSFVESKLNVTGVPTAFDRFTISLLVGNEESPRTYHKSHVLYHQEVSQ